MFDIFYVVKSEIENFIHRMYLLLKNIIWKIFERKKSTKACNVVKNIW